MRTNRPPSAFICIAAARAGAIAILIAAAFAVWKPLTSERPLLLVVDDIEHSGPSAFDRRSTIVDRPFIADVARILKADLQPSFIDLSALRTSPARAAIPSAMRFECQARHAHATVTILGTLGAVGWTDSARGLASSDLLIQVSSCDHVDPHPVGAGYLDFFRPATPMHPTVVETDRSYRRAKSMLLDRLRRQIARDPTQMANLVRYGLSLGDADQSSLCLFTPHFDVVSNRLTAGYWTVDAIDPAGTAYRAGIRVGDRFERVNGQATTGFNVQTLASAADRSGRWEAVVTPVGTDKTLTARYAARGPTWYVNAR